MKEAATLQSRSDSSHAFFLDYHCCLAQENAPDILAVNLPSFCAVGLPLFTFYTT